MYRIPPHGTSRLSLMQCSQPHPRCRRSNIPMTTTRSWGMFVRWHQVWTPRMQSAKPSRTLKSAFSASCLSNPCPAYYGDRTCCECERVSNQACNAEPLPASHAPSAPCHLHLSRICVHDAVSAVVGRLCYRVCRVVELNLSESQYNDCYVQTRRLLAERLSGCAWRLVLLDLRGQ